MFTAYGVAGLAGSWYFKDAAQGADQPAVWMAPLAIIAGCVVLLGRDHGGVHDAAAAIATTVFWLGGRNLANAMS